MNSTASNNTKTTAQITSFLESFSDGITSSNKELYKRIIKDSDITSFSNYEEFYFAVLYPFENLMDGFVRSKILDNSDVAFLMLNSQFVERHFEEIIKTKEGWPCCADKSRTIISSLIKFYSTGEEIKFNYEAEYTYHLPKKVFNNHEHIVAFYEGLKSLFYGKSEKHLKALMLVLNEGDCSETVEREALDEKI